MNFIFRESIGFNVSHKSFFVIFAIWFFLSNKRSSWNARFSASRYHCERKYSSLGSKRRIPSGRIYLTNYFRRTWRWVSSAMSILFAANIALKFRAAEWMLGGRRKQRGSSASTLLTLTRKVSRLAANVVVEFWPPKLSKIKLRNYDGSIAKPVRLLPAKKFKCFSCIHLFFPPSDPFICLSVWYEFGRNERLRVKSLHAISAFRKKPRNHINTMYDFVLRRAMWFRVHSTPPDLDISRIRSKLCNEINNNIN